MLDYARIVEEIQLALSSMVALDWDLLRETAAEYAAACHEVNVRLEECAALLKKGLRSEALQAAEREPNVLDSVAVLDFPELPEWHKALTAQGIVLPPAIRNDIAGDLNMAYFEATPLAGLMRSHRLLALARAPLPERIGVMRQIRMLDQENPVWDQDLRVFEAARLREFPKDLAAASSARDLKRATALSMELEAPGWLNPPSPDLVQRSRSVMQKLTGELAAGELAEVEKRLSAAHSAFDEEAALAEIERWDELVARAKLAQDDPLMIRAAPALHWLKRVIEQRRKDNEYAASIAALEDALDRDADRRTLEQAYQRATRLDFEVPETLERRFAERIRTFEVGEKRRFVLVLSGIIGVLALAASVTLWFIFHNQQEAKVAAATAALQKLVEAGNLPEARKYADAVADQSKAIAERPTFLEQVSRLEGLELEEKDRLNTLAALLKRLESMDIENPDRGALSEAEKLAKSDSETARVAVVRKQVRDADRARQSKIDVEFDRRFRELLARVAEAEQKNTAGEVIDAASLSELGGEVNKLRNQELNASPALLAQVAPLQEKVSVLVRANMELVDLQRLLDGAVKSISDPEAFGGYLKEVAKRHATMASLNLVADEAALWMGVNQWSRLLQEMGTIDPKDITPQDAKRFLESANQLGKDHPNLAEPPQFTSKRAMLEGISNRVTADGVPQFELLQRAFEGRIMTGLWLVKGYRNVNQQDEERVYTEKDPAPSFPTTGTRVSIELPIVSLDLSQGSRIVLQKDGLVAGPAPQAQLSKDVIELINEGKKGDWDATMLQLLGYLLGSKSEDVDPLLRFITLNRVLEVAREGSHAIKVSFEPVWQLINEANVDFSANWLVWNDKQASSSRAEAEATFKAIQSRLKDVKANYDKLLAADRTPMGPPPRCVGWLRPDNVGQVKVELGGNAAPASGKLIVIVPASTGAAAFAEIGSINAGAVTLDRGLGGEVIRAGRLVYLIPEAVP